MRCIILRYSFAVLTSFVSSYDSLKYFFNRMVVFVEFSVLFLFDFLFVVMCFDVFLFVLDLLYVYIIKVFVSAFVERAYAFVIFFANRAYIACICIVFFLCL